jgi:hypothetical protein
MAKKKELVKTPLTPDVINKCLAKAVAEGDIVNLRFLFISYSPLRESSTEDITTDKYAYLVPLSTEGERFREAMALVQQPLIQAHVKKELDKKGPPQLPAPLVTLLADNAVRLGKYKAAAQAYELLRIRSRMQEAYLDEADAALAANDLETAVRGYRIAVGLDYDYAAFPEPMPTSPNYQSRAQLLHADYPRKPEDAVALQLPESHVNIALGYLLLNPQIAARLEEQPLSVRLDFLAELVRQLDPNWAAFTARYADACRLVASIGSRLERQANQVEQVGLADEIKALLAEEDPADIPKLLLGREIPGGEWWQYIKELAYEHPAAALFVVRQFVTKDLEIVMPRYVKGSPVIAALGLGLEP